MTEDVLAIYDVAIARRRLQLVRLLFRLSHHREIRLSDQQIADLIKPNIDHWLEAIEAGERSVRFWVPHQDSWVRITLRPGQTLTTYHWQRTDEGWSSQSVSWTHCLSHIHREWCDSGVDCDGRSESFGESRCELDQLSTRWPWDLEPIGIPDWVNVSCGQRDHGAEAAGY